MIGELLPRGPWLLLLIQGTVCLAVGLAASYALRHRPARAHQALLTALLVAVLMPGLYLSARYFGFGVLSPRMAPSGSTPAVEDALLATEGGWATDVLATPDLLIAERADESTSSGEEPLEAIPIPPAAAQRLPWNRIVVFCWSAASTILLLRLVLRFLLAWRVVHAAHPLDSEPIQRALDTAQDRLGVGQCIRIRHSGNVRSPVIWCWSREPVLLLQENAPHAENHADWTGIFCHEVSHWRRRDHLTGLFTEVLSAAFPWHPLLWWAKDRLLRLSEQACDDWVLATGQNDADYAEMLLGLAAERQMAFVPTTMGKGKTMNLRIRRIIGDRSSDPRIGRSWALAVSVLAVGATVGVAVAQPRPAGPEPMDAPPTKVLKERREIEMREPPGADQQRIAMKRMLERLIKQAGEKKEALREGNDLSDQERQIQQIELKLLVEQIEQLQNRLEASGRKPGKMGPKEPLRPAPEAKFDSLRQSHKELALRAEKVEREFKEALANGQDQEAGELKAQLGKIRTKMADVEKQLDESKFAPRDDLKRKKLDDLKRAQVEVRLQGPAPEQQDREKLLHDTRAKIGAIEQESRGFPGKKEAWSEAPKREYRILKEDVRIEKKTPDGPPSAFKKPAGDPRLEAEVQELRGQMKELHTQMQQMQRLLEQTMERDRTERSNR